MLLTLSNIKIIAFETVVLMLLNKLAMLNSAVVLALAPLYALCWL